jgi:hypothetical protein
MGVMTRLVLAMLPSIAAALRICPAPLSWPTLTAMSLLAAVAPLAGVARCESFAASSWLAANVARERDGRGSNSQAGLGRSGLRVMVFSAVILGECARRPARGNVALRRIFMLMRMRVPPKHELLNDEEHAEPDHQGDADGVRSARPNALHRLR